MSELTRDSIAMDPHWIVETPERHLGSSGSSLFCNKSSYLMCLELLSKTSPIHCKVLTAPSICMLQISCKLHSQYAGNASALAGKTTDVNACLDF
jgi:hypothetical protein